MVDDYWGPSKRMLGDGKFLENINNFDRENIQAKTAKLIREKYIAHPDFNPDKIKSPVPALDAVARAVYCWIIAIDMYEKICRNVCPKREALTKVEHNNIFVKMDLKEKDKNGQTEKWPVSKEKIFVEGLLFYKSFVEKHTSV